MTKYTGPSGRMPKSVTSTMFGWLIDVAARASRKNR